jgi:hypothetical protein
VPTYILKLRADYAPLGLHAGDFLAVDPLAQVPLMRCQPIAAGADDLLGLLLESGAELVIPGDDLDRLGADVLSALGQAPPPPPPGLPAVPGRSAATAARAPHLRRMK